MWCKTTEFIIREGGVKGRSRGGGDKKLKPSPETNSACKKKRPHGSQPSAKRKRKSTCLKQRKGLPGKRRKNFPEERRSRERDARIIIGLGPPKSQEKKKKSQETVTKRKIRKGGPYLEMGVFSGGNSLCSLTENRCEKRKTRTKRKEGGSIGREAITRKSACKEVRAPTICSTLRKAILKSSRRKDFHHRRSWGSIIILQANQQL